MRNDHELGGVIQGVRDPKSVMQHRDASNNGSSASRWKKPATMIMAPTNQSRSTDNYNIYSAALTKGRQSYHPTVGNPTRGRTILSGSGSSGPPKKKQKRQAPDGASISTASCGDSYGRVPRQPDVLLAPNDTDTEGEDKPKISFTNMTNTTNTMKEAIIIDDDDEDVGEPVQRKVEDPSSDELDVIEKESPPLPARSNLQSRSRRTRKSAPSALPTQSELAPDGDATRRMYEKHDVEGMDPNDPIRSSSSPPPMQSGFVKRTVAKYEQNHGTTKSPHIDFALQTMPRIKQQMKPKFTPLSSSRDRGVRLTVIKPPSSLKQLQNVDELATALTPYKYNPNTLPLETWYLGRTRFSSQDHPGGHIEWDNKFIRFHNGETEVLRVSIHRGVKLPKFLRIDPADDVDLVVLEFHTEHENDILVHGIELVKGSEGVLGTISLRFHTSNPHWLNKSYISLTDMLRDACKKYEALRPKDADRLWTMAVQAREPPLSAIPAGNIVERPVKRSRSVDTLNESEPSASVSVKPEPPRISPKPPSTFASTRPRPRPVRKGQTNGRSTSTTPDPPPRRSARQSIQQQKDPPPGADPDEVILVYPQGAPGAVNITSADIRRLEPGEFLNDSLIEFGLKLWLKEIEANDPESAKQFHVFSSFFYKKFNKRNFDEGFESVRKWTAKFNLFEKKYIFVPINENNHWYLAIIHHPEHVLLPPPPPPAKRQNHATRLINTRSKPAEGDTKAEAARNNEDVVHIEPEQLSSTQQEEVAVDLTLRLPPDPSATDPPQAAQEEVTSDQEVEDNLMNFTATCRITTRSHPADEQSEEVGPMDVDGEDNHMHALAMRSPSVSDWRPNQSRDITSSEIFSPDVLMANTEDNDISMQMEEDNDRTSSPSPPPRTVDPESFYAVPSKAKGKEEEREEESTAGKDAIGDRIDGNEAEQVEVVESRPTAFIFTLDSLGTPHLKVIRQLARYLKAEAQDKLSMTDTSTALGKQAQVPVQPNYCDCGVYLLHFARLYMSDPTRFYGIIQTRNRHAPSEERQQDWDDSAVVGMREELKQRILALSKEWKAARDEAKKQETKQGSGAIDAESSDNEIDIVEPAPSSVPIKGKGKAKSAKATPVGKPAARIR